VKTTLVVGSAPCLFEDVQHALALRPFAEIMLVNGACTAIENAEHMLCGHEEKAEMFVRERKRVFPNAPPIKVHGCCHAHRKEMMGEMFPSITDWWPHEMGVGATSASKAAKIAFMLGATEVILCGCPMDQPGYFPGEAKVNQHVMCLRIGDHGNAFNLFKQNGAPLPVQEARIIKGYRANLKTLADGEFKGKVFSMSGFTRQCLGAPPEDPK
jgi:hypothetical protein